METPLFLSEHLDFDGVEFVAVSKRVLLLFGLLDGLEEGLFDEVGFEESDGVNGWLGRGVEWVGSSFLNRGRGVFGGVDRALKNSKKIRLVFHLIPR